MVINLPGKAQQGLRKLLGRAAHEGLVVRARSQHAYVIDVLINHEAVDGGEQREVRFRGSP